jgi:NADPH-dependent 2,4-dienoyl-CoA reductase/sulfur reductase-like enzyme
MSMRVVVIGADAAGGSAASQIKRRLRENVEVVVLEKQEWTSYAACGIPYWIAGDLKGPDGLVARSPEKHRANGLDLHTATIAVAIDTDTQVVRAHPVDDDATVTDYPYDHLVLATGATPIVPPIPGIDLPGIHNVHTLDDGISAIEDLATQPQQAVIVGAGYTGIEMAEACRARGLDVTVLDIAAEPMTTMDLDMGALVRQAMTNGGVEVRTELGAKKFTAGGNGRVAEVVTDEGTIRADIVFLGLGVRPRSELASAAGIPLGEGRGFVTNARQQVVGYDNIWAAGDCVESVDRITGRRMVVALGTHANKQGRVVGMNIGGAKAAFPGIVGTAITKFEGIEIARSGLGEAEARSLGLDVRAATIRSRTRAGYYPGAEPMTVKMVGEIGTGRLLGAQIVGGSTAGKRIDTVATALWAGLTVNDVVDLDLSYVPPLSGVWDPVQVAARRLVDML